MRRRQATSRPVSRPARVCGGDSCPSESGESIDRVSLPLAFSASGVEMRADGKIVITSSVYPPGYMLTDRYLSPVETHLYGLNWSHASCVPGLQPTVASSTGWSAIKARFREESVARTPFPIGATTLARRPPVTFA